VTTGTPNTADSARILAERAHALATPLQSERPVATVGALLIAVGTERYALELDHVLAIEAVVELTPVPGVPGIWSGIANVHGTLYPILDLGRYLSARTLRAATAQMLVVVSGAGIDVGLLVDDVSDVTWLPADTIRPSPSTAHGRSVVQGVTPDFVALLDL
jgi:purine-binding chemotaxis protein CheW